MELRQYAKLIKAQKKMIFATTLVTACAASVFSIYMPASYQTSVSLFITKNGTQDSQEFKYDGYYALESGEIVADNIEKMLQSPQLVEKIYGASGIDPDFKNLKAYKKEFTAKKMSNSYVEVTFETGSRDDAIRLSESLSNIVDEELTKASDDSQQEISFTIGENEPVILESRPDVRMNFLIGIVSGLFLGVFIAFLKKYLS